MAGRCNKRKLNNAGFTLVEMIVVLIIMVILLSLTAFGVMKWQDWSKMKQLDTNAEDIFVAAQTQLSNYAASGSLLSEVDEKIKVNDTYIVDRLTRNGEDGSIPVSSIKDSKGNPYDWDRLWSSGKGKTGTAADKYQGSIVSVSCKPGDFEIYLKGEEELDEGTKLLFKLITSYISDKSILNDASILIEFSPDAGQVFAVCYSNDAQSLGYTGFGTAAVSVSDRSETVRNELSLGYYGADSLSKIIKGKTNNTLVIDAGAFELRNEEILDVLYAPLDPEEIFGTGKDLTFTLNFYNPDISGDGIANKKIMSLEFNLKSSEPLPMSMSQAQGNNARKMTARYFRYGSSVVTGSDDIIFRVPVWVEMSSTGQRVLRIALDAADVQAQSVTAALALGTDLEETVTDAVRTNAAEAFSKTYSFYRFGLDTDRLDLGLVIKDNTDPDKDPSEEIHTSSRGTAVFNADNCIYTTFAHINRDNAKKTTEYGISNARHLYNIRFVEDYADKTEEIPDSQNVAGTIKNNTDWKKKSNHAFVLLNDIDWHIFTAYQYRGGNAGNNYFFNSYDPTVEVSAGGLVYAGIGLGGVETETTEFPAFRQINAGDSFSALKGSGENYSISNLTITTDANERYGVYGYTSMKLNHESLINGEGSADKFDQLEFERARGKHPAGLFVYNYGTIKDLSLERHKVFGAYKVGGFAGENFGTLSSLVLKNETNTGGDIDRVEEALIDRMISLKLTVPYFNQSNNDGTADYYKIAFNDNDRALLKDYFANSLYKRNTSFVVGIQDVGGICGYQKFYVNTIPTEETVYAGLVNEAWVAGQAYVGGIIGRSIVNYNGSKTKTDRYKETDISGIAYVIGNPGSAAAETAVSKKTMESVLFEECENYGRIHTLPVYDTDAGAGNNGGSIYDARASYYLGGICGMACDNAATESGELSFSESIAKIVFRGCRSYWLYTDAEVDSVITGKKDGFASFTSALKGSYVGSITGFARMVLFEDCVTALNETRVNDGHQYIFGNRFVGGITGVAQVCGIKNETGEKTLNEVNVIGRNMVGGFAGLIGTPAGFDVNSANKTETLQKYQYDPWSLALGRPLAGDADRTGKISGFKNTALCFATGGKGNVAQNGWAGGICGYNGEILEECDSILTAYAKEKMLKLIGMTALNDDHTCNCVGGLVGENSYIISSDADKYSQINTIVYGDSYVGGAVGLNDAEDDEAQKGSLINCILVNTDTAVNIDEEGRSGFKGSYIRATGDYAGGVCGLLERGAVFNDVAITDDLIVHSGNYAGGFIGAAIGRGTQEGLPCQYSADIVAGEGKTQLVKADGFYAGGFAGAVMEQANHFNNTVSRRMSTSGVTGVSASFFAGGFAGAAIIPQMSQLNSEWYSPSQFYMVDGASMTVRADMFAGGYYGYYEVSSSYYPGGAEALCTALQGYAADRGGMLNAIDSYTASSMNLYTEKYYNNTKADEKEINAKESINNLCIKPDKVETGLVEAEYFAGGLFGYVPEQQSIFISFDAKSAVTASAATSLADGFSYAGGVIGRTGQAMVLYECTSSGAISTGSQYLGNLTELNRGVITGCTVGNAVPFTAGLGNIYVGGLCGRNEGYIGNPVVDKDKNVLSNYLDGYANGDFDVKGYSYVGGLCGMNGDGGSRPGIIKIGSDFHYPVSVCAEEYAGGICGYNRSNGVIVYTDDGARSGAGSADIKVKARYAGLLAGRNEGAVSEFTMIKDVVTKLEPRNTNGEDGAAGSFFGINAGTITDSINLYDLNTGNIGSAGGFAGVAEKGAIFTGLINRGNISAGKVAAGIVAFVNDGEQVIISECRNYGTISSVENNAYGITSGAAVINNCLEAGGIRSGERIYGSSLGGKQNYYIDAAITDTTHEEEYTLSNDAEHWSTFKAEESGAYSFTVWYEKDGENTVVASDIKAELNKGNEISLSVNGVFTRFWPGWDEEPADPAEESDMPTIVPGAVYHLTVTAPATEFGWNEELAAISAVKQEDNSYWLYAITLSDRRPYYTDIKLVPFDPSDPDKSDDERFDLLDNEVYPRLINR